MKNKLLSLITVILLGLNSFASHIPGSNITWSCDPTNPLCYNIIFTQIINCPSTNPTSMTSGFTFSNNCGLANPTMPTLTQTGSSIDVAQTCASATSTCQGGTVPGAWLATYEGVVCFPANCDSWTIDYELCCRDANSNTAGGSGNSMHVQSILNTTTAPCNNGPVVTSAAIPYMCANQQNTYCLTVTDPDADSTYFQMTSPLGAGGVPIAYNAPYSINSPLQNFVLDPATGCMTFNQPTTGNFVVAVLIESYDAFGNLISSVTQDFQIEVITCSNNTPSQPVSGGIQNFTSSSGSPAQTGPGSVAMCYGDQMCFDIVFDDPDIGDTLTITTDALALLPGATFTTTGVNPVTGTLCWTAQPGYTGNIITFNVQDNACPIYGTNSFSVILDITTGVWTGPDDTICGSQISQLIATGGTSVYNWTAISGPAINVGTNFSCNPCANPVASPTATTTYVVTSTLSAACSNTDTVTVNVVPDFTIAMSQSTPSACLFDPVQLDATVAPAAPGYSYLWYPAGFLNSATIPNPSANITVPGTHVFYVDITSPGGCVKTDSITVTVTPFIAPDINILTPDSLMPCGDSIQVQLDLGGGIPALCGVSPNNTCSSPSTLSTIGAQTGQNTTTTWPAPYGNWYRNAKHQFLFTAAELNAMGFMGGKITALSWDVTQINGTTGYTGYTISMTCTQTQSLTTWESGLTQVYYSANYNVVLGTNTHVLDNAYEWDGISNLVVEICYNNLGQNYTQNSITPWTTAFNSSYYFYSDGTPACPYTTSGTSSLNRPITKFDWCPTIPDPNAFNYSWTPNQTIITSTSQNPLVFPSQPTQYIVTVSDTGGNCFDTDTLNIDVLCGTCYPPLPAITNVTCKDGSDGMIVIDPVFVFGSEVQSFTWQDSTSGAVLQTTNNLTAGMQDSLVGIPAGTYIITMTDSSGCSADTTVTIYEPDSVQVTASTASQLICIGGSTQISANASAGNGAPYTYHWIDVDNGSVAIPGNGPHTVNPTANPHCYEVYAEDAMGCISSPKQVCINLYPPLIASTSDDSLTVCPGLSTNIDMSAIGGSGSGYNYNWYENNVLIGSGSVFNVTPTSSPTTYIGVVTDNCTTPADSVTIYVDWFDLPNLDFTRNKPDSCYPITIELDNTSTPFNLVASTSWNISDGTTLNGNTVSHTFGTPVCHDVTMTVTTVDGCVLDTTFFNYICPHPYPEANFYMTPPITDVLNTEIDFTNLSTGDGLSYVWNFGSGLNPDSSVATHPTFIYPEDSAGTYYVTLTVTNMYGCVDTIGGTVFVNSVYLFYIPNTFTPDGDGKNEFFRPEGDGIDLSLYTMQIFDRWGELLYEAPANARGWDGTYKGKAVQVDTYVWRIVAKELDSPIIHENYGHVNLIK